MKMKNGSFPNAIQADALNLMEGTRKKKRICNAKKDGERIWRETVKTRKKNDVGKSKVSASQSLPT